MATITADVKRDTLCELGADACRILDLMKGCYGHYGYAEQNYGITRDAIDAVFNSITEVVEWIKEEHGVDLTTDQVYTMMSDANASMEEAWDRLIGY